MIKKLYYLAISLFIILILLVSTPFYYSNQNLNVSVFDIDKTVLDFFNTERNGVVVSSDLDLNILFDENEDYINGKKVVVMIENPEESENVLTTYNNWFDKEYVLENDVQLLGSVESLPFVKNIGDDFPIIEELDKFCSELAKRYENVSFLPLIIPENLDQSDAFQLANKIMEVDGENSFTVVISDFESSEDALLNEFQRDYFFQIVRSRDFVKTYTLAVDNRPGIYVLWTLLKSNGKFQYLSEDDFLVSFNGDITEQEILESEPSLVVFGDAMLGRFVSTLMRRNGEDYPFESINLENYVSANDLAIANLEGPITSTAVNSEKDIPFKFDPEVAPLLKKYHFDLLQIANNHSLDQGWDGYEETKEFLDEAGLSYFGDPRSIPDDSVKIVNIRGRRIAFIGFEDAVNRVDKDEVIDAIYKFNPLVDDVIVMMHSGIEYVHSSSDRQKDLARSFIDAGARMVIGHHPHVVQEVEIYKDRLIFYSLGNFIFDQYFSSATQEGLSLGITLNDSSVKVYLFPIKIVKSQPRLMTPEERTEFLERFAGYGNLDDETKESIYSGILEI